MSGAEPRLGVEKGFPVSAVGATASEVVDLGLGIGDLLTPFIALSRDDLEHNAAVMADWVEARGLSLQPHAKTTMSTPMWDLQLRKGAIGLTVATLQQAVAAARAGIARVQLANELASVDQVRVVSSLSGGDTRFCVWADSPATVDLLEAGALPGSAPLDVLVDVGAEGGRTGTRSLDEARSLALRIAESPVLDLAGVAGYEGALAHDRTSESIERVRAYLALLGELSDWITAETGVEGVLSVGGSIYFDEVASVLGRLGRRVVLRSGAYLVHDHGVYERLSPLSPRVDPGLDHRACLVPAARGYARVQSHPEPDLFILEGGKREFAYDEGLPLPLRVQRDGVWRDLAEGLVSVATNDHHTFLRGVADLRVGDLIELGLSHPCTIMDKWRWIPVVDDWDGGHLVDAYRTEF
ncbi:hypothetical protein BW730_03710 [Tessaracoccus aquimaris]|uniref:D-serine dehydratase-like domain-containing protein n=1 Tax=Tessaracoccus aquimaris TaxID=1332264 RepID=A0A1Q2CKX1_9ACTN|nr:alanine racemase [Tessaracoccus aquimaris]AQP46766.1 hypothetical protein BW730_03710 [Tessaracoccus aquimaris]